MKVRDLRLALDGVDDDLDVVVRAENDEGDFFCGSPATARPTTGCDDELFFAIDCDPEEFEEEDDEDAIAEDDQAAPEASKE